MTATPTAGDMLTDEKRQQIDLLLGEKEKGDAAHFRRKYAAQLEPLQRQYRAGILNSQPDDLAATEFLTRCDTAIESFMAWQMWRRLRASASSTPRFPGNPFARARGCGHEGADRRCLCCRRRWCAKCQPESGGARCRRCRGPVWRDDEELCPPRRNPALRGHNR